MRYAIYKPGEPEILYFWTVPSQHIEEAVPDDLAWIEVDDTLSQLTHEVRDGAIVLKSQPDPDPNP